MLLKMSQTERPFSTMPFLPEMIGRKGHKIVLGKMSGSTVIKNKLAELKLNATKEQVKQIVEQVKREAIVRKWSIPEELFESMARAVLEIKDP